MDAMTDTHPGAVTFGDHCVLVGNHDLDESCVWVPTDVVPGTTPLPSHETDAALASIQRIYE